MLKRNSIPALTIAMMLFVMSSGNVFAAFSGDICYTVKVTQNEGGPVIPPESYPMKLHVKTLDPTTCVAQSLVAVPGDNPVFLSGVCRVSSSVIYLDLTLTQSDKEGSFDTSILQAKLNGSTFNGPFKLVGNGFDPSARRFSRYYSAGTFTKINCP